MAPAIRAFVGALIDHYETRIADLESQIQNSRRKTPRCRRARNIRMPNQSVPNEMVRKENAAGRKDIRSITVN